MGGQIALRTEQLRPVELRASYVRATQQRPPQIGTTQIDTAQIRAFQIRAGQDLHEEVGVFEVCHLQLRPEEQRSRKSGLISNAP